MRKFRRIKAQEGGSPLAWAVQLGEPPGLQFKSKFFKSGCKSAGQVSLEILGEARQDELAGAGRP